METRDALLEIESLQLGLLPPENEPAGDSYDGDESPVMYTASFSEMEEHFVNYQTSKWVLYSLLLILAWGVGLLMLLYLPVRRFVLRKDIRSRKLYVTPNAIVYKVTRPVPFPFLGVSKKEKYVLLPSVADIVIEQGYLQSYFGIYSVRIENVGVRRSPSDDLRIQGIANPNAFRKAVLTHLANMRAEFFHRQSSQIEDAPDRPGYPQTSGMSPSKTSKRDAIPPSEQVLLEKLENIDSSIKKVQRLMEDQQFKES